MNHFILIVKKVAPFFLDVWQYLVIVILFILAMIFYL